MPEPTVWDEDNSAMVHAAFVSDPASPGGAYVQAEVVALRTAIVAILACLRSAGLMAKD
jgi:hypothetical protein